jgi:hypothetical protein
MSAIYEIQTLTAEGWTNDASLLGHGASQADNEWATEAEAAAAIDDLVAAGFDRDALRVAEA